MNIKQNTDEEMNSKLEAAGQQIISAFLSSVSLGGAVGIGEENWSDTAPIISRRSGACVCGQQKNQSEESNHTVFKY